MNYSKYEFTLNLKHTHSDINIPVLFGDTLRRLLITLCDGDGQNFRMLDGSRALLVGKKEDGTIVVKDCIIENNKIIRCNFSPTFTNSVGNIICEIRVEAPSGEMVTSPDFCITVQPRSVSDGEIEIYNEILTALESIKAAEESRVLAEERREAACAEAVAALSALIESESYIPTIGDNGNWYINGKDTEKSSVGKTGDTGPAYTLTEADRSRICDAVLASLPVWEGGSY